MGRYTGPKTRVSRRYGVPIFGSSKSLERKNYPPESVKPIKEAFRLIYRSKYNTGQAIEAMRKELPPSTEMTEIIEFIEKSERGIIRSGRPE